MYTASELASIAKIQMFGVRALVVRCWRCWCSSLPFPIAHCACQARLLVGPSFPPSLAATQDEYSRLQPFSTTTNRSITPTPPICVPTTTPSPARRSTLARCVPPRIPTVSPGPMSKLRSAHEHITNTQDMGAEARSGNAADIR